MDVGKQCELRRKAKKQGLTLAAYRNQYLLAKAGRRRIFAGAAFAVKNAVVVRINHLCINFYQNGASIEETVEKAASLVTRFSPEQLIELARLDPKDIGYWYSFY